MMRGKELEGILALTPGPSRRRAVEKAQYRAVGNPFPTEFPAGNPPRRTAGAFS